MASPFRFWEVPKSPLKELDEGKIPDVLAKEWFEKKMKITTKWLIDQQLAARRAGRTEDEENYRVRLEALNVFYMQHKMAEWEGEKQEEIMAQFRDFLLGKSKWNDKEKEPKTPIHWGKRKLVGDDIDVYLEATMDAKYEFDKTYNMVCNTGKIPSNLREAWMFFCYKLKRGNKVPTDMFLKTWEAFYPSPMTTPNPDPTPTRDGGPPVLPPRDTWPIQDPEIRDRLLGPPEGHYKKNNTFQNWGQPLGGAGGGNIDVGANSGGNGGDDGGGGGGAIPTEASAGNATDTSTPESNSSNIDHPPGPPDGGDDDDNNPPGGGPPPSQPQVLSDEQAQTILELLEEMHRMKEQLDSLLKEKEGTSRPPPPENNKDKGKGKDEDDDDDDDDEVPLNRNRPIPSSPQGESGSQASSAPPPPTIPVEDVRGTQTSTPEEVENEDVTKDLEAEESAKKMAEEQRQREAAFDRAKKAREALAKALKEADKKKQEQRDKDEEEFERNKAKEKEELEAMLKESDEKVKKMEEATAKTVKEAQEELDRNKKIQNDEEVDSVLKEIDPTIGDETEEQKKKTQRLIDEANKEAEKKHQQELKRLEAEVNKLKEENKKLALEAAAAEKKLDELKEEDRKAEEGAERLLSEIGKEADEEEAKKQAEIDAEKKRLEKEVEREKAKLREKELMLAGLAAEKEKMAKENKAQQVRADELDEIASQLAKELDEKDKKEEATPSSTPMETEKEARELREKAVGDMPFIPGVDDNDDYKPTKEETEMQETLDEHIKKGKDPVKQTQEWVGTPEQREADSQKSSEKVKEATGSQEAEEGHADLSKDAGKSFDTTVEETREEPSQENIQRLSQEAVALRLLNQLEGDTNRIQRRLRAVSHRWSSILQGLRNTIEDDTHRADAFQRMGGLKRKLDHLQKLIEATTQLGQGIRGNRMETRETDRLRFRQRIKALAREVGVEVPNDDSRPLTPGEAGAFIAVVMRETEHATDREEERLEKKERDLGIWRNPTTLENKRKKEDEVKAKKGGEAKRRPSDR